MVSVTSLQTKQGNSIALNRFYSTTPDYTAPQDFAMRMGDSVYNFLSTELTTLIPITNGDVLDDASDASDWSVNSTNDTEAITTIRRKGPQAVTLIKNNDTIAEVIATKELDSTIDATDTDYWGFFFIDEDLIPLLTETESIEIRLETDASNYYYKTYDRSELAAGWNIIKAPITEFEEEGSPTITTINDITFIFITDDVETTTIAGDIVLDEQKLVSEEDYFKPFVSGFPDINEVNNEATIRMFLTSVEAVGFDVSGIGVFNRDTPRKNTSGATFPSEIKTFQNEFTIVQKNRIL